MKFVNPQVLKITGRTEAELLALPFLELVHPDDRELAKNNHLKRLKGETVEPKYQLRILRNDKSIIWIEMSGVKIEWEGQPATLNFTTDITKRKRAESQREAALEELRESEKQLKEAQCVGHLGFWDLNVVTGDLQWSDECYRIYGFRPQEFIPTYEKFRNIVHPEDLGFVQGQVDAALNNDKHYNVDFRFVRPNGEIGWIHCNGEITRDAEGKSIRFFGTQIDITERKREDETLIKSENKLNNILTNIRDVVWSLSWPDFNVLYLSPSIEKLYGRTEREFIENTNLWQEVTHPDDKHVIDKALEQLQKEGTATRECRIILPDGSIKWIYDKSKLIFDQNHIPVRVEGLSSDITERKEAEEEIKRQLAEKEILLREVHHRIKNNIVSIGALISMHLKAVTNPEAIAVLQDASGRINSMGILYDKLLVTEGYKDVSVKKYVESLVDTIAALFPEKTKIALEKRIADFQLDPKRLFPLGLIINELLTNKMKYAFIGRDAGKIKISLTIVAKHIKLTIADNGIGLPDGFDINETKGFGLKLVGILVKQLGGSFAMGKKAGNRSMVEFEI